MQAYGSDRVRSGDGDQFVLLSRFPKGWIPRTPKSLTTAEFPGTAVLWEERYFEVIDAEALPRGGARYVLEPWLERHVMRKTDRYDAGREAERLTEYRATLSRETKRKSATLLAFLAGHLPAAVQEELGRELGIQPARQTLLSVFVIYDVIIGLVLWIVSDVMRQAPVPLPLLIATGYLFVEASFRFFVAWQIGRPIGSVAGTIGYLLYYYMVANRAMAISPFAREKGMKVTIGVATEEWAIRDALLLREPLVTLLSPADQARVAERFGYNYKRQSWIMAAMILLFALLGMVTSMARDGVISLFIAAAVAAEQVYRLIVLRSRPVGSILGIAVRPFMRKLL
ncbi:MAG TPA: hypothetical protein VLC46_02160 [Thermoanaerobaculia bacterium]|jgi:hypothetical protein|nr:hypothetical protein [Thermoanaerobaculia bacterium]